MRHHAIEDFGGRQNTRDAGAGMRAGADQIEAGDILAAVVRAEPRALGEHRLQPEGGALPGA